MHPEPDALKVRPLHEPDRLLEHDLRLIPGRRPDRDPRRRGDVAKVKRQHRIQGGLRVPLRNDRPRLLQRRRLQHVPGNQPLKRLKPKRITAVELQLERLDPPLKVAKSPGTVVKSPPVLAGTLENRGHLRLYLPTLAKT